MVGGDEFGFGHTLWNECEIRYSLLNAFDDVILAPLQEGSRTRANPKPQKERKDGWMLMKVDSFGLTLSCERDLPPSHTSCHSCRYK